MPQYSHTTNLGKTTRQLDWTVSNAAYGGEVLGGFEQQKIVRLIGTFSKSTFIGHAAVFVKAAFAIYPISIRTGVTHPTPSRFETNNPKNATHKSFDPLTSARTFLSLIASSVMLPMSQSDC